MESWRKFTISSYWARYVNPHYLALNSSGGSLDRSMHIHSGNKRLWSRRIPAADISSVSLQRESAHYQSPSASWRCWSKHLNLQRYWGCLGVMPFSRPRTASVFQFWRVPKMRIGVRMHTVRTLLISKRKWVGILSVLICFRLFLRENVPPIRPKVSYSSTQIGRHRHSSQSLRIRSNLSVERAESSNGHVHKVLLLPTYPGVPIFFG